MLAALLVTTPCAAQTITVANKPSGAEWADFGPIRLHYTPGRHEVVVTSERHGHQYRWVTRDRQYASQLTGGHCLPLWQTVRMTRWRLIYSVMSPRTGRGRVTSIARACLERGGTCYARRIDL
jgi:hypothetical protein